MKIYIVMGMTGEYSDHRSWLVCAYRDRAAAEAHELEATKRARTFRRDELYKPGFNDRVKEVMGEFDPNCCIDYTGTDYCTLEVELRSKLP